MAQQVVQAATPTMVTTSQADVPLVRHVERTQSSVSAVARRSAQVLDLLNARTTGKVLIFEPRSAAYGRALRAAHVQGERYALLRCPIPAMSQLKQGYDHLHVWDWADGLSLAQGMRHDGVETTMSSAATSALGPFELIIVSDAIRLVQREHLAGLLAYLSTFLSPRGFLILSEPASAIYMEDLQDYLVDAGLLQEADNVYVEDTWPHVIATFQKRPLDEARHIATLQRTSYDDLHRHAALRQGLVATYRDVFGGDEWREWVRCTRPGCGRRYSKQELHLLGPKSYCTCGWTESLVPFHTAESILAKAQRELADSDSSCCHLRVAESHRVEAFAWGYISSLNELLRTLVPPHHRRARGALQTSLMAWLATMGLGDETTRSYYHSELGVLEDMRSFSLGCELFRRGLQFAYDRGVQVVILRSSLLTNASPICFGLGMQVLYRYDRPYDAGLDARDKFPKPTMPDGDNRVILGGNVRELLESFARESDRRLALRVGRRLRMGQGESRLGEGQGERVAI